MKTGVWLHGDSLSKRDPALRNYPEARSVFVFDRPFLEKAGLSFKRIFFLYECAVEVADEMRVGETVEEILDWVRQEGVERLAVQERVVASVGIRGGYSKESFEENSKNYERWVKKER